MNNYWGQKQQKLVEEWVTASDPKRTIIYKKLYPAIREMTEQISNRYYSIPQHNQLDYRNDCIQNLFLNLHKYDKSKKKTAYSYCSALIKYWYYDKTARQPKVFTIEVEYQDELPENIENLYQDKEIDFERVLKRLQALRKRYVDYHKNNEPIKRNGKSIEKCVLLIDIAIKHVIEYQDINPRNIAEDFYYRSGIDRIHVSRYFYMVFGLNITPADKDFVFKEQTKGLDYTNDDWCPIDSGTIYSKWLLRHRRRNNNKRLNSLKVNE